MKLFAPLLLAAGIVGMASAAQAMPAAPAPTAPGAITQVDWSCGPGWHVNRWGNCSPNRRFYGTWGYVAPPRFHRPHWHHHRHWHPHRHWRR